MPACLKWTTTFAIDGSLSLENSTEDLEQGRPGSKAWSRRDVVISASCYLYFLILLYLYISSEYCKYKLLYLRPSYHLLAALNKYLTLL